MLRSRPLFINIHSNGLNRAIFSRLCHLFPRSSLFSNEMISLNEKISLDLINYYVNDIKTTGISRIAVDHKATNDEFANFQQRLRNLKEEYHIVHHQC
jgi:hypothetical protein